MTGVSRPAGRRARLATLAAGALLVPGLLAGCSGDNSVAAQAKNGDQKGYVAGDGSVSRLAADQRGEPVHLSGTLLDGTPWSSEKVAGKVVVVNVWGSWCGPCQSEAPHLVAAAKQFAANPAVAFIGIDVDEAPATGAAGAQRLGLPYPSLSDENRALGPALQGKANATPTTLVLDRRGRIAARISGAVTTPSTLTGLIQDVAAEHG